MTRNTARSTMTILVATAATLIGGRPATAQDALGGGNALDGNLQQNSGGVNTRVGRGGTDYNARNLIVTGDVAGGRGFRSSVGYTAPGDFRGNLGSDDLFQFRAGSAFSDPRLLSNNSLNQLRFGQALGAPTTYRRSAAPTETQDDLILGMTVNEAVRLDRNVMTRGSLNTTERSMDGRVVGQDGEALIHASSLRGIRTLPIEEDPYATGISMYDRLRLRAEQDTSDITTPGRPYKLDFALVGAATSVEPSGVVGRTDAPVVDQRIASLQTPDYQRILEQIAERYAGVRDATWSPDSDLVEQVARDYKQLQDQLAGSGSLYGEPGTGDKNMDATARALDLDDDEDEDRGLFGTVGTDETTEAAIRRQIAEGLKQFGTVLRHGERIDRLGTNDVGRFNELLRDAEQRLREGEYFWAERRFVRALQFVPGHPTATAGLAHAQLGAGLYGSAALTLRSLFTHQPEMIDARYDERLLPSHMLLERAVAELRRDRDQVSRPGHDGFLIAYIGHQTEDDDLVAEGLDRVEAVSPEDPLLILLRATWQPLDPLEALNETPQK